MAKVEAAEMQTLLKRLQERVILAKLHADGLGLSNDDVKKLKADIDIIYESITARVPYDGAGNLDEAKWIVLDVKTRDVLRMDVIVAVRSLREFSSPGPSDPLHIMAKGYPSRWLVRMLLWGCGLLTLALLFGVYFKWDDATNSCKQESQQIAKLRQDENNRRQEAARIREDVKTLDAPIATLERDLDGRRRSFEDLEQRVTAVTRHSVQARALVDHAVATDPSPAAFTALANARSLVTQYHQEARRILDEPQSASDLPITTGAQPSDAANLLPTAVAPTKSTSAPSRDAAKHSKSTPTPPGNPGAAKTRQDSSHAGDSAKKLKGRPATAVDSTQVEFNKFAKELQDQLRLLNTDVNLLALRLQKAGESVTRLQHEVDRMKGRRETAHDRARQLETEAREAAIELAQAESTFDKAKGCPPSEQSIITMVILIGALGGCLRLISSLTAYIGNRELKSSWVPYYCLIPLQGATLAAIVYLFVRAGAFSATVVSSKTTDDLNVFNIYVYSGLSGMFAKDVTVKVREMLEVFFRSQSRERDKLGATNPSADSSASPKPNAGE